ncbi:MAG: hypothetical protein LBL79_05410 [Prevotella sp.]|jgi:hypothetical protein|nr:hypothetical protein [Prevotella sp.]
MSKVNTVVDESKNPAGKKIIYSDRVNIKAVSGAKYLKPGTVYSVHPELAKKLIARKVAEKA